MFLRVRVELWVEACASAPALAIRRDTLPYPAVNLKAALLEVCQ
jgi:hypothetical protein